MSFRTKLSLIIKGDRQQIGFAAVSVFLTSLVINSIGITWGQPSGYPWTPDSIAGATSYAAQSRLNKPWRGKYPKLQYVINSVAYSVAQIIIEKEESPKNDFERQVRLPLPYRYMTKLVIISRAITALMGAIAVLATFLITQRLFHDLLAAWLAGLALSFNGLFVFYAHVGNVDVPLACWVSWTLYFGIRTVQEKRSIVAVMLGVCAACAQGTKDPAAGYLVGTGLSVVGLSIMPSQLAPQSHSIFQRIRPLVIAVVAFLLVFSFLNDIFTAPEAYLERIEKWLGTGQDKYTRNWGGYLNLSLNTLKNLTQGLGWPLAFVTLVGMIYCLVRYPHSALFSLLPFISFFCIVTLVSKLPIGRYFIPGFVGLAIISGKTMADFLRLRRLFFIRIAVVAVVLLLSFMYALAVDFELLSDSRHRAEYWLRTNVASDEYVACLYPPVYGPKLYEMPFNFVILERTRRSLVSLERFSKLKRRPDYVVLSRKAYGKIDRELRHGLLNGSLGYDEIVRFDRHYLSKKNFLSVAQFQGFDGSLSPRIVILRRKK